MNNVLLFTGFLLFASHFVKAELNDNFIGINTVSFNDSYQKSDTLYEFRKGDIIVKPNNNWLPGSSMVYGGKGFGHVALVIKGGQGNNLNELLRKTVIFESHARDVPVSMQVREYAGLVDSSDYKFSNMTFGPGNQGFLYLLRADLTEEETDNIIQYIKNQNDSQSCWRAQKKLSKNEPRLKPVDEKWYCSLLIWQAFFDVLGIDLDINGGVMVYPNDIINSTIFDNDSKHKRRVKF